MNYNDLTLWSTILLFCLVALLVEGAAILRTLFTTRAPSRHYLLLFLPLAVSLWSFAVLWHALNVAMFPSYIGTHFSYAAWLVLTAGIRSAIVACQVQSVITLVAFGISLFLERRLLPQIEHEPAWVTARQRMLK